MLRRIIEIDQDLCNGCGACAQACHEQAIVMKNGKATLLRDDYCDGLGDCLPSCPTNAISFVERDTLPYDQAAVNVHIGKATHTGCPGSQSQSFTPQSPTLAHCPSALRQWPVQIRLVPINAPYLEGADLLIAADCTAYAYGNFHRDFIDGHVVVVGCPKLDSEDSTPFFTELFTQRNLRSVTVVRMEVPCCGGLQRSVEQALSVCQKDIPYEVVTITIKGEVR